MTQYTVLVGNVGTVYSGDSEQDARLDYDNYVRMSKDGYGRPAWESVTLMADDEIAQQHVADWRLDDD